MLFFRIRHLFSIVGLLFIIVLFINCQKFSTQDFDSFSSLNTVSERKLSGQELITSKGCLDTNVHNPHTDLNTDTVVSWYGDSKMYGGCYLFPRSLTTPSQISNSDEWQQMSVGSLESPLPKKVSDLSGGVLTFKQRAVNATTLFQLENGLDGVNLSWQEMMTRDRSRIVVLAHGTNDVWQDMSSGRDVNQFRERLKSMVEIAISRNKTVILMEPYKVCSYNSLIPSGAGHTNEQAQKLLGQYVQAIREVAKLKGLSLIPAFDLPLSCPHLAPLVPTNPPYRILENPFTFDVEKDIPDQLHANQNAIDRLAAVAVNVVLEANHREEEKLTDPRVFDVAWYLAHNPDVKAAYGETNYKEARNHWLIYGVHEGRQAHPQFNSVYYLNYHSDIVGTYGEKNYQAAIKHYTLYGFNEGRVAIGAEDPLLTDIRVFNVRWYLERHIDVRNAYGDTNYSAATQHWLKYGLYEGRQGSEEFSAVVYLEKYSDVNNAYGSTNYKGALRHYLIDGIRERRTGVR